MSEEAWYLLEVVFGIIGGIAGIVTAYYWHKRDNVSERRDDEQDRRLEVLEDAQDQANPDILQRLARLEERVDRNASDLAGLMS